VIAQAFYRAEQRPQIICAETFNAAREVCDSRDLIQVPSDRPELRDGRGQRCELAIWQWC
jgi:hypothetical protein